VPSACGLFSLATVKLMVGGLKVRRHYGCGYLYIGADTEDEAEVQHAACNMREKGKKGGSFLLWEGCSIPYHPFIIFSRIFPSSETNKKDEKIQIFSSLEPFPS
jgi:hypothetical protein